MTEKGFIHKFIATIKETLYAVIKGMLAFRRVLISYAIILLVSAILYGIYSIYPNTNLTSILATSRNTVWGIVTSIFMHSSLSHFSSNMAGLLIFILMFTFSNSTYSLENKKRVERFTLFVSFIAAIVSNVVWVILTPVPSIGASGLVYAVMGAVSGYSLLNGLQILNFSKIKAQKLVTIVVILMNLFLSVFLIGQVFQDVQAFLNVGERVNVIAHGTSYLIVIFSVYPYCLIKKISIFTS